MECDPHNAARRIRAKDKIMTTWTQYLAGGDFSAQAEMACDMFSHVGLTGRPSSLQHRKMLHSIKRNRSTPVLSVVGPLYPNRVKGRTRRGWTA